MRAGKLVLLVAVAFGVNMPGVALAHRSGCHNLHTCPSDTGSYVCGDLGYPCNGATSIKDIPLEAIHVPLLVEKAFNETFGRVPTVAESAYWKNRFRNDKDGLYKIRRTMSWHKGVGSFGPTAVVPSNSGSSELVGKINALFRSVYMREPMSAENRYWISRTVDKPYENALRGAMNYHKEHNIIHN